MKADRVRIKQLYEVEGLSINKIAKIEGVTRQAIYERLVRVGADMRPRHTRRRQLDRADLYRLYVTHRLPVYLVAKALNASDAVVKRELERHAIELRPKGSGKRTRLEMDGLEIGKSAIMAYPVRPMPYSTIYELAKMRKIRVSIRRIDADHVQVTRVS